MSERAAGFGPDLPAQVAAARDIAREGKDVWERAVGAVTTGAERAAMVVDFIKERIGGGDKDPLMPDRLWSMKPAEIEKPVYTLVIMDSFATTRPAWSANTSWSAGTFRRADVF